MGVESQTKMERERSVKVHAQVIFLILLLLDVVKPAGELLVVLTTSAYLAASLAHDGGVDGAEAAAESSSALECSCAGSETQKR